MQSAIFDTPVLKVESLKTKFDIVVISNSFIALIGDYVEARLLHQLHYWSYAQYGVVIDGIRWIYKPYREWLSEVFTCLTDWQLRKAIASLLKKGLIRREKLYVKHHEIKHDNPYWHPKNQTYYYSVNYDKLQELIEGVENTKNAETIENVRIENLTKLSVEDFQDTKYCELSQDNTKNTSIENSSKDKSHPTLPCECDRSGEDNQSQQSSKTELTTVLARPAKKKVDSVNSKVVEKEISSAWVDENINQNINTNQSTVQEPVQVEVEVEKPVAKPKPKKTPKGTKPNRQRRNQAPWKDEGQFRRFYRALVQALPQVANAHSPQGLAQTIIRQLRAGIPHSYWDDFIAGLPIGTSTMPEWEVAPGEPYPMFIEFLTEKIKRGDNTQSDEQTRNEVFRILNKPRQAKAFWGQFKRSLVNVSERVERDLSLGVSNPNTPTWTRERIEPSLSEAAAAGEKIMAVNGNALPAIESANNPQLESKSFAPVSQSPSPPVPQSSCDPWTEDDKPQPTMREMLAARGVKGFCKPMPKVSQAEDDGG
ncbi:MAG: hypothetical protein QNJ55_35500 [Xenococcus sp. MO_188.B8]|nr:hypothetical protein [Xenococcus sp. MO_188.B8]